MGVVVLGSLGRAYAQSPPGTPSPPSATTGQPMPAVVGRPLTEHTVDRHGLVLLGGISRSGDSSALRVDLVVPVPLASAPQLRLGLTAQYDHSSAEIPDLSISAYGVGGGLYVAYDWRLPIATEAGDFVVSIDGGPDVGRLWLKVEDPSMPGSYDTITAVGLHVAGSLQYRAHGGLVIAVQPLGVAIPIAHTEIDASPFMVTSDVSWVGALLVGYQFE
jgi:hypothetical protein